MATGQEQFSPLPLPAVSILDRIGTPQQSVQGILDLLQTPRQTFSQMAFPSIVPLLQPSQGITPEIQEAIGNIQSLGQEGITRGIATATTEAQKRGITGSNIEFGAIGEAQRLGEQDILRQVTPLIAGEAERKFQQRNNLANFLTQSFGVDFQGQESLLDKIGQVIADELGRQTSLEIGKETAKAQKTSGMFQGIGSILGGLISDRRLKENIKQVGTIKNGLPIYTFKYKNAKDKRTHIGLMAQDVIKVNPKAVFKIGKYYGVNYAKAVA
jgi:hypothetical protein